jgi:maltose O-acetyltransferase
MLSNANIIGHPNLRQPMQAIGKGVIQFDGSVNIGFFPSPYFFSSYAYLEARGKQAKIIIGNDTSINNGFVAIAEHTSIQIGERVLIGSNVEIIDSDFHGINLADRCTSKSEWAKPVVIENDVFLGSNVRVCKGVTIGSGTVVANGSIVVEDVPSGVISAGNPAKVIRYISEG